MVCLAVLWALTLTACPYHELPMDYEYLPWFEGRLQKGPFVQGEVRVWLLDERFMPAGEPWIAVVGYDGAYSIRYGCADGPAMIEATGPYFNEVTGLVEWNGTTLRAVTEITQYGDINVNVLTTLAEERIRTLAWMYGIAFPEARRQAEAETLAVFGFSAEGVPPFEELDLLEDGMGNAMLLAASAILQQGRTPEELASLISRINRDLVPDGVVQDPDILEELRESAMALNCREVRENLVWWLVEDRGMEEVPLPAFEAYVDSDGDGRLNRDQDPSVLVSDPEVELLDRLPVQFVFDAPMIPASVVLSGELADFAGEQVWTSDRFVNDTLTIQPADAWPAGEGKTLVLSTESVFGRILGDHERTFHVASGYFVYTEAGLMPTAALSLANGDFAFSACCDGTARHEVLVRMNPDLEFLQQFQLPLDFEVLSIAEAEDGGYVLAGRVHDLVRVERFSADGQILWGRNRNDIFIRTLVPDGQSGFMICGNTRPDASGDQQALLWNVDGSGATVSSCTLGGSGVDTCADLIRTGDEYLLYVSTSSPEYGAGLNNRQGLALRSDGQCNVRWQREIGGRLDEFPGFVRSVSDGGVLLGGTSNSYDIEGGVWLSDETWSPDRHLIRLDGEGLIVWQSLFGSGGALTIGKFAKSELYWPEEDPDDLCGVLMIRLGPSGDKLWQRILPDGRTDRTPFSWVSASAQGTIVIASLAAADFNGNARLLLDGHPTGIWVFRLRDDGLVE
jgi:hypothetical protein